MESGVAKADFCIEIDFAKNQPNPARVFRAMTGLIEAFEAFDHDLVRTIDSKIEPILMLEDVEEGSIRAWLAQALRVVDDDALKDLDWKKQVGKYLVKAKYLVIDFLEGRTEITDRKDIEVLEARILDAAKETDVLRFPSYVPVRRQKLLGTIEDINDAVSQLGEGDKARYSTGNDSESASFNLTFNFSAESIEELLTRDRIEGKSTLILKVKKPDYLGESQWVFRHGKRRIEAKILDAGWLEQFQNREVDVRPGDSLKARVSTINSYDHDGELISIKHVILSVEEVIPMPPLAQFTLLDDEAEDEAEEGERQDEGEAGDTGDAVS